jgi:hypothetical protein
MNAYLQLMPGNHLAYAMRGMAYIRIGDKLSGCSDLRMAANFGNEAAKKQSEQFCK